jgi:hypothetical protein
MCCLGLYQYRVFFCFCLGSGKVLGGLRETTFEPFKEEQEEMMQNVESFMDKQVFTLNESLVNFFKRRAS